MKLYQLDLTRLKIRVSVVQIRPRAPLISNKEFSVFTIGAQRLGSLPALFDFSSGIKKPPLMGRLSDNRCETIT
jgi:hypothetical protein